MLRRFTYKYLLTELQYKITFKNKNLTVLTLLYSVLISLVTKARSEIFDRKLVRHACQLYKMLQLEDLELDDQHAV